MTEKFINAIKRSAAQMDTNKSHAQWGTVQTYDPATGTAKVNLQPENQTTDWLPVNYSTVGQGIGLIHPPVAGQQVCVVFDGGSHDNGIIMGGAYSNLSPIPNGPTGQPIQSGEFCAVFGNGQGQAQSYLYMEKNGNVLMQAGQFSMAISPTTGFTFTVGSYSLTITPDNGFAFTGPITQSDGDYNTTGDVIANNVSLDNHNHGGVQSGDSDTGPPNV